MRLEDELGCFGLYGFGSGHVWGRANVALTETLHGADSYCAKDCPQRSRCLTAHLRKCQFMFPRATQEFDQFCKKMGQRAASQAWQAAHPDVPLEPYALQMVANTEDGMSVAQTGAPKNRGRLTMIWPRKQEAKA